MPVTDTPLTPADAVAVQSPSPKPHLKINKKLIIVMLILILTTAIAIIANNISQDNLPTKLNGLINVDNGDSKINWSRYTSVDLELSESITITNSGIYHLTGSIADGMVTVDSGVKGEVKLILDNVSINNSTGPVISCISGDDLVIELVGNNTLADGETYNDSLDTDINGAIYSKADLTFEGTGTLNITSSYQDAIVSKDDLKFNSGTYHIVAANDGIRGKDSVYIIDGLFNITAVQDAIKSTNSSDSEKGFVLIEGGDITISAGDDGIHGERVLAIQSGIINISKSYEGLESPIITINGGNISILSSDDGINASNATDSANSSTQHLDADDTCIITINGGDIYINSSGDGIDSNGEVRIYGGNIVMDGPTNNGNGALDSGLGITVNGGSVVAVGSSGMAETPSTTSSIYSISVYFNTALPAGTNIQIKDTVENIILEHTSAKSFSHAILCSEDIVPGSTYSIYIDGVKFQDFTITSKTTTIGNSNPATMKSPNRPK